MDITPKSRLRLLGRVSARVLKRTFPGLELKKPNTEWFFVSYSSDTYPVSSTFDIFIPGSGGEWNHDYKIKLLKITDEYGRRFNEISDGFKTICCFQFTSSIPKEIKQLPVLTDWEMNEKGVYLFQHSEINLMPEQDNTKFIFQGFLTLVWKELKHRKTFSFKTKDIADILSQKYDNSNKRYIRIVLDNLVLTGKAKEKDEDKYELVDY